jgi:hypothetical protein
VRRRARTVRAEVHDAWALRADDTYRRAAAAYRLADGSRRVYCFHVRKTAGTSLHLAFLSLGGEDPWEVYRRQAEDRFNRTMSGPYAFQAFRPDLLDAGAYFYGRSHHPWDQLHLPPGTFTVTVLRDPLARARSYHDYLVAGDTPGTPRPVGSGERRLASGGFDAFLDRIPDGHLLSQLAMFSSRLDPGEAADRIAACSAVLMTEDFDAGVAVLGERLGLPLSVVPARVTPMHSPLSEAQEERLRARLVPEYELLRRLAEAGVGS